MNGNAAARRPHALASLVPGEAGLFAVAGLGLLLAWFSFYTIRVLHPTWLEAVDYSHGYLVLILTAWLIFVDLRRAPPAPFVPSWLGLTCLVALVFATLVGLASTTMSVAAVALPALWMATVWAVAGLKNARRFALPLAYLYVAMPIWSFLSEPLRRLTVVVVTGWIRTANLPAYIEGNLIHVPSGTFEVQGGCAGLRYALIAVALAAFANLLGRRRWAPSTLLIAAALLLGLVGNWVRVFITVAVGQSEANNLFTLVVRDHHTFFGWILFALFMIPLFYLDRVLQQRSTTEAAAPAGDVGTAGQWRFAGAYAACALLAVGISLNYRIEQGSDPLTGTAAVVPPGIPGWEQVEDWQDQRRPLYLGAAAQTGSWYAAGTARVGAYVAHYSIQQQDREAVSDQNRPEGQSGAVVARRSTALTAASGVTVPFEELEVADSAAERRLVWVGVRVAGKPAANALAAKALQIAGAFQGRHDAQVLVLTAVCAADECSDARSSLSRYATAALEPLREQAEKNVSTRLVRADAQEPTP